MQDPDITRLKADWYGMEDPERAVATAMGVFNSIVDDDAVYEIEVLEAAAESAFDGPGGDPFIVFQAVEKSEPRLRRIEPELPEPDRLKTRLKPWLLKARALYRSGYPEQAVIDCYAILKKLEEVAGGRDALADVLTRSASTTAEIAVGALGLLPAALRRAAFSPAKRGGLEAVGLTLTRAYVASGNPVAYPRSHALASQWFFYLVHVPDADEDLLKVLYVLDERTRPADARARATLDSLAMEYEYRFGSSSAAEGYRSAAIATLQRLPLLRHRRVVAERGYLAPRT